MRNFSKICENNIFPYISLIYQPIVKVLFGTYLNLQTYYLSTTTYKLYNGGVSLICSSS
jgi:hypothetical protein